MFREWCQSKSQQESEAYFPKCLTIPLRQYYRPVVGSFWLFAFCNALTSSHHPVSIYLCTEEQIMNFILSCLKKPFSEATDYHI